MSNDVATRYPWEPATLTVEDAVKSLQRDFAYAVLNTAVLVRSENQAFRMLVNTPRGQIIPLGEVKFTDGTTVELQDLGMPQISVPYMTVQELMAQVYATAIDLGLELTQ